MILILRLLLTTLIIGILLFITIIALGNGYIYYQNQQYSPQKNADTIIILGAHIEGYPLRPSLMLQYRLDKAVDYWRENPEVTIVTTGGKTVGYSQSEAQVMQQYLIQQGIPQAQILLEEESTRTAHQFINAQSILKNAGKKVEEVVIITNDFHLPRSMMLAKRSGLTNISGLAGRTPQDQGSKITAHIREPLALLNSWLFDHPE
ncbi:YdcF family protein [Ignatzschineria rhizosphaerae]|uniref:YdcF family protein n=1 Tax=Ignatzschineria rhizosphaerae TaxID=2923279 RepID=A0ABY3X127_9GAMM|nr:YdcF family protein [Ignatzschineria rhizosphaerae]UNM96579.1 YdcF family protein [Ignatzschineria rhizosphaerae]